MTKDKPKLPKIQTEQLPTKYKAIDKFLTVNNIQIY